MLRRHVVFNRDNINSQKTVLLYGDLQYNPMAVNAAKLNTLSNPITKDGWWQFYEAGEATEFQFRKI